MGERRSPKLCAWGGVPVGVGLPEIGCGIGLADLDQGVGSSVGWICS